MKKNKACAKIYQQIREKLMEYRHPVFMYFIDMTKAFNKIRLKNFTKVLSNLNVSKEIIRITHEFNSENVIKISNNQKLTNEININTRIRQRD